MHIVSHDCTRDKEENAVSPTSPSSVEAAPVSTPVPPKKRKTMDPIEDCLLKYIYKKEHKDEDDLR